MPPSWAVEILRYPPRPLDPGFGSTDPVDVTRRVDLSNLGTINRAIERDLLSFRTGDVTLRLANSDGFLDELFSALSPTDRWGAQISRDGHALFKGVVLGQGSVIFDRLALSCEMTIYGPTKILQDTSAEKVKRAFPAYTVTTASAGSTLITLNTTSGLLTGDVLRLSNEISTDRITVRQVVNATQIRSEAALVNSHASGIPVEVETPYHRYKDVEFLVRALFSAAGIPIAELLLGTGGFAKLAPTNLNLEGLNIASGAIQSGPPAEKDGLVHVTIDDDGTYNQASPDGAWTKVDSNQKAWIDFSRYLRQDEGVPAVYLRNPIEWDENSNDAAMQPWCSGFNFKSSPREIYFHRADIPGFGGNQKIQKKTSTDGTTWGASSTVYDSGIGDVGSPELISLEYDPVRNAVWWCWFDFVTGAIRNKYYDIGAATPTDFRLGDDVAGGYLYVGPTFVPELDAVLMMRGKDARGSVWEIAAWRGLERLWVKPFPRWNTVNPGNAGGTSDQRPRVFPTQTMRWVNGVIYGIMIHDGEYHLFRTDDVFDTVTHGKVASGSIVGRYYGGRVGGRYYLVGHSEGIPKHYQVAAPFFAGVVSYADYDSRSVSDALNDLAVLANAVYWVDEDFQGHFISREFLPTLQAEAIDVDRDVVNMTENVQWDDSRQFVTVSGGAFEAGHGDNNFVDDDIDIQSDLIPNEPYASALAESFHEFFSKARRSAEVELAARGRVFSPLDRISLRGRRWFVHESDHDLGADSIRLTVLEDV